MTAGRAAVWLACAACAPRLDLGDGVLEIREDGREIALVREGKTLLRLPADAFAVGTVGALDEDASYDPFWLEFEDETFKPAPPEDLVWRGAGAWRVEKDGVVAMDHATLTLRAEGPGRFSALLVPKAVEGEEVAYLRVRARAPAGEAFYGLGEWPDGVEHRGKLRPMQLEPDLGVESASTENHVVVPLLIGASGWAIFVESRRPGVFDVARKEADLVEITYGTAEESGAGLRFHLLAAAHPLDLTGRYYDITGAPRLPAPWAMGPWTWRDETTGQAQTEDDIRKIRELDLAGSGIWIDRPYATKVNTFDFDAEMFPDPAAMIRLANEQGLRVALWHAPYLEEGAEPFLAEATAQGYFPPRTGLLLNRWGKPIDFTNPAAFAFWQALVRRYTSLGIEGFKLDYAEDVATGIAGARSAWRFHDGSDERTMHHGYTPLYHRAYAETLPADGGFLLCRAGKWGDQKNGCVIWPGDLDASFARHREKAGDEVAVGGLPASIAMGLGLGPSGFPFYGADTGGYRHSPPPKEVLIRWLEQTALSPVMQTGNSASDTPWERDAETLALYRDYARLHLRLFPYLWTYAMRLAQDGRAIMRPLGLAYPALGEHPSDTYLLGDHLLVAPVVEAGATSRRVKFPPGRWIDWWDGTVHEGGTEAVVPAPLEKLPLFLAEGGIVPMLRPSIDTLAPASAPGPDPIDSFANGAGTLHARIGGGAPEKTSFTLYDGSRIGVEPAWGGTDYTWSPGAVFTGGAVLEVVQGGGPLTIVFEGAGRTEVR
jgi:alpha-D-xyloside xylohydrolase